MKNDDPRWKEFVTRPALRFMLQFLAGLAMDHQPTQMLLAHQCIPILHQMEQVSSDEHVGSLAEAVLESLKGATCSGRYSQVCCRDASAFWGGLLGCAEAEKRIKLVREQTKAEKKKLAMAMRAKQLEAFGLKANDQGQVKAGTSLLQKFVGIAEESGELCPLYASLSLPTHNLSLKEFFPFFRTMLQYMSRGLQVPAKQGFGHLHLHDAVFCGSLRADASQIHGLLHCLTLQLGSCGLSCGSREAGSQSR